MDIASIVDRLIHFRDERGWMLYHTPRNLAESASIECAELLELYQWDQSPTRPRVAEEVADVMIYLIQLADLYDIDLESAVHRKIDMNAKKYPV